MSEHTVNVFETQRLRICPGDSERTQLASTRMVGRTKKVPMGMASVKPPFLGPA
jgi:hypothetical protein